jgi:hypothetical protein
MVRSWAQFRLRDVEFLRRRLSVSANAVQIGTSHAARPTKGRKARSVSVLQFVLDELGVQCKGKTPGGLVFLTQKGARFVPTGRSEC